MADPLHVVCAHCNASNRVPPERLAEGGRCGRCKQALFTGAPIELDTAAFRQHVRNSDLPVVVDFWAPWCGPCRAFAPVFARAAAALEPRFRLAKLNTEAEPAVATELGIRSIPTLIVFQRGRELARRMGASDYSDLVGWLESLIR